MLTTPPPPPRPAPPAWGVWVSANVCDNGPPTKPARSLWPAGGEKLYAFDAYSRVVVKGSLNLSCG